VTSTPTPYYQDTLVTLYNADCLEILPTLNAGTAHAFITDPPYIIGAVSSGVMASKSGSWQDMMNSSQWFSSWYREAWRILKHEGALWSFCNWRSLPVVMRAAIDAQMPITSTLVWDKQWIGPGGTQGLRPSYELVTLSAKPDFSIPDRGVADVWQHKVGSYKPNGHPAEKPEGLVRRLIKVNGFDEGCLIVDPFAGSGTTAAAAKSLNMRCITIEADERYCEQIAKRLSQDSFDFVPTGGESS